MFIRSDHIEEAWGLVDRLIQEWEADQGPPLHIYEPGSMGPEAADELLAEVLDRISGPAIYCREGVTGWKDQIADLLGPKAQILPPVPAARVWALAAIGWKKLASGETSDTADLQPEYLRMPSIGVPKQRDRVAQSGRRGR